ncbi:MAG: flagellar biosynthesis anti-sigma factor FlgM [Oscillospiraceae bacterium]|jgi:flagellar biosynthesis anti-sigma factor FlgM|nr:flagellar biosynthesis anti-sigma factor FlgM [Oscillospiraceae bacterium]
MKINTNPVTNRDVLLRYTAGRAKPVSTGAAPSQADKVTFSDEALSFSKVISRARESIETRSAEENARIGELKESVRRGEYRIDSEKIAESIVSGIWL